MTREDKKYYNKKFLPSYMRKLNIALPAIIIAVLVIGVVALFLAPADYMTIAAIGFLVALLVAVIVMVVLTIVFNKKLIAQRTKEVEEEYTEMPFEEAQAALKARGVLTEDGFAIPSMGNIGEVVPKLPFKDAAVYMFSASVCTKVLTVVSFCNKSGGVMAEYLVDRELYNYLKNAGFDIVYYGGSDMLFGNKEAFVKKVIKTRNNKGMGYAMLGGAVGAALSERAKDQTPEMEAVLRVLHRENI